jgi:DNA repair protein RecN (Recombination protein N)
MLTSLSISNYALIDKLEINFSKGFSTITGETGAGKSIILGALGLVLGKRADLSSLKNKDEKCIIEAQFAIEKYNLKDFFTENDIDYEPNTIIRREIVPSGKSRAFVNDCLATLSVVDALGNYLVDIHSQQQTQELSDEKVQFTIIDAIADNKTLIADYQLFLKEYKQAKTKLNKLLKIQSESKKEESYNTFLLNELIAAKLNPDLQEVLEDEYNQLNNVEIIKESIEKALVITTDEQVGTRFSLIEIKNSLQKIVSFSPEYQTAFDRVSSLIIELDDIQTDLENQSDKLISDPEQLETLRQRLQLIYDLQKKHQVNNVEALIEIQNKLNDSVLELGNIEDEIESLTVIAQNSTIKLDEFAQLIFKNRQVAVPVLTEKLNEILFTLGMPNARFDIQIIQKDDYFDNGKNEIQLLFSANKGSDFGMLKKVASGGEMSRIMLAIKAILANYHKLPTLIFDEIDTGVSGEIAIKMGEIMKQMSQEMQVFAITHLPQIAAKGDTHYKVFKTEIGEETLSELKLLNKEERITEIAQMLSGAQVSDSALIHAKSLLD